MTEEQRRRPSEVGVTTAPLWRTLGLSALSGLLLSGALPKLDWGWLAWIALVPILSIFPLKNGRTAFAHGLILAVFFSLGMTYWVAVFAAPLIGPVLGVVGWALLTIFESVFFGVWALGAQWLRGRSVWAWRLGVPAFWVIVAEWGRQLGALGLSWGDLAYTQHRALPILQLTKLTGIWGLGFLIALVNVAVLEAMRQTLSDRRTAKPARRPGAFPVAVMVLVVAALIYGLVTIRTERLRPTFVAAALQNDIDQNVPHDPAYVARVLHTFTDQSRTAASHGATLVVWPETAFPGFMLNDLDNLAVVRAQAARAGQSMVVGSTEYNWEQGKDINSLFFVPPTGPVSGRYQKRLLVPFGEYVPGVDWVPALASLHVTHADFLTGENGQPLMDGGPVIGKLGATLCFESSYPRLTQEQVVRGAGLLVISADDTLFGHTSEVRQHSAIAAVRAAETDRYLVRCAATGISQIVDPTGRVLTEAGQDRAAVVWAPVQSRTTVTPYVRWGDWFVAVCAVLLAVTATLRPPHRAASVDTEPSQGV
jgi:apolipoprotein N-acyltransferase